MGNSTHELILTQNSQSGLRCGSQTTERPDARVSACYLKGHQLRGQGSWILTPVGSASVFVLSINKGARKLRHDVHELHIEHETALNDGISLSI